MINDNRIFHNGLTNVSASWWLIVCGIIAVHAIDAQFWKSLIPIPEKSDSDSSRKFSSFKFQFVFQSEFQNLIIIGKLFDGP